MADNNWDEIDDEAMEEMVRIFEQMGMPVDLDTLRSMIKQVRSQFEEMGIDPEKMSMSEVKLGLNSESEDFMRNFESMMNGPQGLGEFLKKLGVDIHIKPAESEVTVDVDENLSQKEDDSIPDNDVFVQGNKMSITIDISNYDDIESENIELSLTGGGEILQLLRINQIRPFRTYVLPHACVGEPRWEVNNGILDITFELE